MPHRAAPSSVVWRIKKCPWFNLHIYSSAANEWYASHWKIHTKRHSCHGSTLITSSPLIATDALLVAWRDLSTEATSMTLRSCTCELADGRRWCVHDEHDKTIKHHFAAFVVLTVRDEQVYHQWQGVRNWIRYRVCLVYNINKWEGKIGVLNFPGNFRLCPAIFPACAAYVINSNMAAATTRHHFWRIANKLITPIWSAQKNHNRGWTILYVKDMEMQCSTRPMCLPFNGLTSSLNIQAFSNITQDYFNWYTCSRQFVSRKNFLLFLIFFCASINFDVIWDLLVFNFLLCINQFWRHLRFTSVFNFLLCINQFWRHLKWSPTVS
jgi:hypothetical protein